MGWTYSSYCDAIGPEIERLATVSRRVAPTTPVPTCPEWSLVQLVRHTGSIHRWVTVMVEQLTPVRIERKDLDLGFPDDDRGWSDWLLAGAEPLARTLRAADPDAEMWSWGEDQHVRFWPRRMLHETCIHRVDGERAAGARSQIDGEVARDGIEELLGNLALAARFSPTIKDIRGDGETLRVQSTDRDASWLITLQPDGFSWERSDAAGSASLSGPVADLYLVLYRRLPLGHPGIQRSGDAQVLDHWIDKARI